jgi:hypothetical protein
MTSARLISSTGGAGEEFLGVGAHARAGAGLCVAIVVNVPG